jgi:flagellar hook-associated protein 2
MATITSLGVGAGIDLQGLLEGLMSVERQPLQSIQNKVASHNTTISALGTLSSKLSGLRTAAQNLKPSVLQSPMDKFATYGGSLGDEKLGKVTVGDGAVSGNYSLEILKYAKGQKTTAGLDGSGGTLSFSFGDGSDTSRDFSVEVAAGASMADVARAINAKLGDVSATVVGDKMIFSSKEGTGNDFQVSGGGLTGITKTQTASDGEIKIDGISVTSQSNKFSDALTGVTIDLTANAATAPDPATLPDPNTPVAPIAVTTLSVTKNSEDKLLESLQAFVKAFNDAASTINSLGAYDAETKVAGALQGQSVLRDTQSTLNNLFFGTKLNTTNSKGEDVEFTLSNIGISLTKTGQLTLDTDKLKAAIASNPEGVAQFASEVGKKYDSALNDIAGIGGSIEARKNGITKNIRMLEDQTEAMERRLEKVEERYRAQFTALDTLVAKMNSTSSWLAQSLAAIAPR